MMNRSSQKAPELKRTSSPKIDVEKLEVDGKKIVGLSVGHEKEEIQKLKVSNQVSPVWKENLKEALILQGGSSVKDIQLKVVDSFVWAQDGIALYVESVIVELKDDNNAAVSFRVLVDASNGKILKNWDQPVIDPVSPKDQFSIKVDQSYED